MNRRQRRAAVKQRPARPRRASAPAVRAGFARGLELYQAGRLEEAGDALREVPAGDSTQADALHLLGVIEHAGGRNEAALPLLERAVAARPDDATFHNNLGTVCKALDRDQQAVAHYSRAVELDPQYAMAHNGLGTAYLNLGMDADAKRHFETALAIEPDLAMAEVNLGLAYVQSGDGREALQHYQRALDSGHIAPQELNALGLMLQSAGYAEEAESWFRTVVAAHPHFAAAHSNLLVCLHYRDRNPRELFAEHRHWAEQHAARIPPMPPARVDLDPDRCLRVGYVTPDLDGHSVGYFFRPLLEAHDRRAVEVTTYTNRWKASGVASWLRDSADEWRDTTGLSDEEVAALVRRDRIDILVDLAGHTVHNHLLTFARRPAPVQVAYLGYLNTTGLDRIDYRIVDAWTEPPGETEHLHTEELVRLPGGGVCYQPRPDVPAPTAPPHLRTGHVTFGATCDLVKVGPEVMELWAGVMQATPGSRFLYKTRAFQQSHAVERVLDAFAEHGIAADRVELIGFTPSLAEHFEQVSNIDVALDCFPFAGHTTTCETLWLGVPVVTLAGRSWVGRMAGHLLDSVGLGDLVAADAGAYVQIATALARDSDRLTELRRSLRPTMAASPLCDAPRLATEVEDAYRAMWRRYVERAETT